MSCCKYSNLRSVSIMPGTNVRYLYAHCTPRRYARAHVFEARSTSLRCKLFVDNAFRGSEKRTSRVHNVCAHPSWYARLGIANGYIDYPKTESNIDRSNSFSEFDSQIYVFYICADHIKWIFSILGPRGSTFKLLKNC